MYLMHVARLKSLAFQIKTNCLWVFNYYFIIANLISLLVSLVRSSSEEWKIPNRTRSNTQIFIGQMDNTLIPYLER